MSGARAFFALAAESARDALRGRVGVGAVVVGLLVLLAVDRCSAAGSGGFVMNGMPVDPAAVARVFGPLLHAATALFLLAVVAFVASDCLAAPIADGSVLLWMARPVSRGTYACARLAGALALSAGVGALVLAVTAELLHRRHGLALGPGLVAIAPFLLGAVVVGALSALATLFLPRVVALFAVLLWIQSVVLVNVAHLFGADPGGSAGWLERYGPPLGTGVLFAVAPWTKLDVPRVALVVMLVRLSIWALVATGLLVLAFRRRELVR